MKVEYIDHMGDDLRVVNAARVSYNKQTEPVFLSETMALNKERLNRITEYAKDPEKASDANRAKEKRERYQEYLNRQKLTAKGDTDPMVLRLEDWGLIHYLAKHGHWTPFGHPQLTVRVTVPIFVANQLKRHVIGFCLNEVSRRYVDDEPEFFEPKEWRSRPEKGKSKQGSGDQVITMISAEIDGQSYPVGDRYNQLISDAMQLYDEMITAGVAPELARMSLPQSMYTSWYWTGSLYAYINLLKKRLPSDAQKEIRIVAQDIYKICNEHWPVSLSAYIKEDLING